MLLIAAAIINYYNVLWLLEINEITEVVAITTDNPTVVVNITPETNIGEVVTETVV